MGVWATHGQPAQKKNGWDEVSKPRIEKDQLGKLFALANQQYEPLFVRNARPQRPGVKLGAVDSKTVCLRNHGLSKCSQQAYLLNFVIFSLNYSWVAVLFPICVAWIVGSIPTWFNARVG